MTSQFQESNKATISTIQALDEFEQLEQLQTLIELAFEQLEHGSNGIKRAEILIHLYLKNSSEHTRSVRKALETVQSTLISNKGNQKRLEGKITHNFHAHPKSARTKENI